MLQAPTSLQLVVPDYKDFCVVGDFSEFGDSNDFNDFGELNDFKKWNYLKEAQMCPVKWTLSGPSHGSPGGRSEEKMVTARRTRVLKSTKSQIWRFPKSEPTYFFDGFISGTKHYWVPIKIFQNSSTLLSKYFNRGVEIFEIVKHPCSNISNI